MTIRDKWVESAVLFIVVISTITIIVNGVTILRRLAQPEYMTAETQYSVGTNDYPDGDGVRCQREYDHLVCRTSIGAIILRNTGAQK